MLPLLLSACSPAPVAAPSPDPVGTLVFVTEADGAPAAARVPAGGGEVRLLPRVAEKVYPGDPAPDGSGVLAIGVDEAGGGHTETLWFLPLDDAAPRRLSPPAGRIRSPAWSADGAWITLEADWHGHSDLYRLPAAGGEPGRLTTAEAGSFEPVVRPDGRVAFGTSRDGNAEIYTMAADGTDLRRITDHPRNDTRPRWSPDGRGLAWLSDRGGRDAVWIQVDDGDPHPLRAPEPGCFDKDLAWSPDHHALAVVVQTSPGELRIDVVDTETGATLARIDGPGVDEMPTWSPDGAWIALSSHREGDAEITLARADGRVTRRMTRRPGPDWLPRWSGR